jgi:hypothetical protein
MTLTCDTPLRFSARKLQELMRREERGPSWVGRRVGRSRSYMHMVSKGSIRNPAGHVVVQLARLFGVPVDYFYEELPPDTNPPGHTVILLARTLHVQADALFDSPPVQSDPAPGAEGRA